MTFLYVVLIKKYCIRIQVLKWRPSHNCYYDLSCYYDRMRELFHECEYSFDIKCEPCKFIPLFITSISFNCAFRFEYLRKHLLLRHCDHSKINSSGVFTSVTRNLKLTEEFSS